MARNIGDCPIVLTTKKTLALGVFPVVTLARARESVLETKRLLQKGIAPNVHKKQLKQTLALIH